MLSGHKDGGTLTANLTDRIAVPMKIRLHLGTVQASLTMHSACTIFHEVNQEGVVREHGAFCRY